MALRMLALCLVLFSVRMQNEACEHNDDSSSGSRVGDVCGGTSDTSGCKAARGTNQNFINPSEFVDEHNAYRCELGLEPLAWDCELAAVAQKLADELANTVCTMKHSRELGPRWHNDAFVDVGYPDHPGEA